MSDSGKAVFLSYASQDAEAAQRIAEALRASGVEVWFDQNELVGGDAWDAKIRRQIKECALFVPVISANTQARREGYFRLEWRLAVERMQHMDDDLPFLLPVVIDDTTDAGAFVPEKFRAVQWTRLSVKDTPATLAARVGKLLGGGQTEDIGLRQGYAGQGGQKTDDRSGRAKSQPAWLRYVWAGVGIVFALVYAVRPLFQGARRPEPKPPVVAPPAQAVSEARQLAEKARALFEKIDSNADDFALADSLLKRALELDATDGEIWAWSARLNAAFLTRNFDRGTERRATARSQAERAIKLAPDSAEAWHALGRAIWTTDTSRAEEALRHALQLAPTDGRILISLGSICRLQNRSDDALAFYVQAAAQPDVRPLALYDQFLIHLYSRRFTEADRCVRESIAGVPTTNNVTGLAMLQLAWRGDVGAAQRALATASAAQRSEPRTVFATALVALMARQTDAALRALDRLPGDFINDAWFSGPKAFLVGLAHAQAGRPEAARIAWEAGIALVRRRLQETANDSELHLRLGELLAWSGQADAALREARVFEELARNRTDWTYSSARIYAALGRAEDAVPILEKYLVTTAAGRWPLTPALLRLDPLWDKLRDDPRFQELTKNDAPIPDAVAPADDKSVAVLAFANLSDDKANEFFSDGISEELLNVLAKVPGLTVRGRSSGFYFKGKQAKTAEIGQQLNVAYLVQGSVRRAGDRVRISAQLIRAATDEVVWSSGSLDRDVRDIFAVQDEIAGLIAKNLSVSMGVTVRASHRVNPEALTALLEGRQFWLLRTMEGFARAGVLFRRAVELDPDWAPAHAALANLMTIEASYRRGGGESVSERFVLAAQEAKRAIELDPNLGEPHAALGKIEMENLRHAEADEAFRRALALEPSNALVRDWYGDLLVTQGRLDLAIAEYRRAAEIEPLSPYILWDLAWELMHVRRYGESLALVERAIALTPSGAPRLTIRRARLLLELGRKAEAEAALRPFLDGFRADSDPQIANEMIWCLQQLSLSPDRERWTAELLRQSPGSFSSGVILLMRGEEDRAYPLLEKCPPIFWQQIYWDPVFDPVRATPRFRQMLEKLGCAAEYQVARATLARLLKEAGAAN
jgi:TolB-like protein/tetratricopeptide (TPR) repeat protein